MENGNQLSTKLSEKEKKAMATFEGYILKLKKFYDEFEQLYNGKRVTEDDNIELIFSYRIWLGLLYVTYEATTRSIVRETLPKINCEDVLENITEFSEEFIHNLKTARDSIFHAQEDFFETRLTRSMGDENFMSECSKFTMVFLAKISTN